VTHPLPFFQEIIMLRHTILPAEGILLLEPSAPLSAQDFASLSADVDAYLATHARLHGVMVRAQGFPGWDSFGGFTAHMHFVRDHHRQIERLAVVTDSPLARTAELLGKHFTSAEVRHFAYANDAQAMEWLRAH
jgi:tRNA U38,U39,U40 pseudouridine synthase TruA